MSALPHIRKRIGAICVATMALVPFQAAAESPAEAIAQAFKASEAATHRRVQLNYRIADRQVSHVTTRVLPDRSHIVITRQGSPPQEYFVIGGQFFTKTGGRWQSEPLPVRMNVEASAIDAFMPHFAGLQERPRQTVNGRQQRVFAGNIAWQAGRDRNEGPLQLLIDAQTKLPTSASFEGQCGSAKCSFSQSFAYDRNMKVEQPK